MFEKTVKTMEMTILDGFIAHVTKDKDDLVIRVPALGHVYEDLIQLGIFKTSKKNVFVQRLRIHPVKENILNKGDITPEF